jgi:hypothetical protein
VQCLKADKLISKYSFEFFENASSMSVPSWKPIKHLKGFAKVVGLKGVMHHVLFPYLGSIDLLHFAMLSKQCRALVDPQSPVCVNYRNLILLRGGFPGEIRRAQTLA